MLECGIEKNIVREIKSILSNSYFSIPNYVARFFYCKINIKKCN